MRKTIVILMLLALVAFVSVSCASAEQASDTQTAYDSVSAEGAEVDKVDWTPELFECKLLGGKTTLKCMTEEIIRKGGY